MSKDTAVAEPSPFNEIWTYVGRRLGTDDKLYHAYRDANGRELNYDKRIAGSVIGGNYHVCVTRKETDGKAQTLVTRDRYEYIGPSADPKLAQWVAEDVAATTTKDALAREKKDATAQLMNCTLEEIKRTARRMPTPQRRALIAAVIEALSR